MPIQIVKKKELLIWEVKVSVIHVQTDGCKKNCSLLIWQWHVAGSCSQGQQGFLQDLMFQVQLTASAAGGNPMMPPHKKNRPPGTRGIILAKNFIDFDGTYTISLKSTNKSYILHINHLFTQSAQISLECFIGFRLLLRIYLPKCLNPQLHSLPFSYYHCMKQIDE